MEKIKLTSEQAEKIEWAKDYFKEDGLSRIVELRLKKFEVWEPVCAPLIELKLDDLIRALYIGYEVEYTPEELVKQYHDRVLELWKNETFFDEKNRFEGELQGIRCTVEMLGFDIEGVNKH